MIETAPTAEVTRGIQTDENTNGLPCQYTPEGKDLSVLSRADVDAFANQFNT